MTSFLIGHRLAEIQRLLATHGPTCSRNRTDVQELLRRIEAQMRMAAQDMEREARESQ